MNHVQTGLPGRLSEKQCDYAAADVFYLLPLAAKLVEATEAAGRMDAAKDECLLLCRRRSETLDPELATVRLPMPGNSVAINWHVCRN